MTVIRSTANRNGESPFRLIDEVKPLAALTKRAEGAEGKMSLSTRSAG